MRSVQSVAVALLLSVGACAPALNRNLVSIAPALSQNPDAPELALLHYRMADRFDRLDGPLPTICAGMGSSVSSRSTLLVRPLPSGREQALIAALPVVAPLPHCEEVGHGYRDAMTGEPAIVFDVHDLTCATATDCTAWAGYRQDSAVNGWSYYRLRYSRGAWRIRREPLDIILTSDSGAKGA